MTTLDRDVDYAPTHVGWSAHPRRGAAPATGPPRPVWALARRSIELVLAVILLLALGPIMLAIAIAIRLDSPGPLLFAQTRCGRDGRRFTVLKYRTMCDGACTTPHRLFIAQLAADGGAAEAPLKKLTDDPRITRVGAFLRRTSIDELPQLINVIKGEMSIVGPRPALEYELEHYESEHFARFDVRPGMTGLWQVAGRSTIGFRGMLDLDVEYARTAGPRLDALILLRTPRALLRRDTA